MNRQPQDNSQQAIQRKKLAEKIFKRNFENPLDKIPNLWYNKYSQEGKEPNLVEITQ